MLRIYIRIRLEKAEAALLLLVALAAALAARLALLLAALAAALALLLAVLAGNTTGLGHLYLIRRFFIHGGGQKLMNAALAPGQVR